MHPETMHSVEIYRAHSSETQADKPTSRLHQQAAESEDQHRRAETPVETVIPVEGFNPAGLNVGLNVSVYLSGNRQPRAPVEIPEGLHIKSQPLVYCDFKSDNLLRRQ